MKSFFVVIESYNTHTRKEGVVRLELWKKRAKNDTPDTPTFAIKPFPGGRSLGVEGAGLMDHTIFSLERERGGNKEKKEE